MVTEAPVALPYSLFNHPSEEANACPKLNIKPCGKAQVMTCYGLLRTATASVTTPRRVSRPETDRKTEKDPPAPGKHQLTVSAGCILITVSEENLSQNHLAKPFLNSPPTEVETTHVYCFPWTWKEKETAEKHCHMVVAAILGVRFKSTVVLLARALGKGLSAALDSATFHIWDVWSAFKYI